MQAGILRQVSGSCPAAAPSVLTPFIFLEGSTIPTRWGLAVAGGWGAPPPATR